MRRSFLAGGFAVALTLGALAPADATLPKSLPKDLIDGYVPSGPYRESCSSPHMQGPMLIAYCERDNGVEYYSSLDTRKCKPGDEIVNRHGSLMCWKPEASPSPAPSSAPKP